MKTLAHAILLCLKKPVLYVPFVLVLFGMGWFLLRPDSEDARFEFATAELADVRHVVSLTGSVKPRDEVILSFERGGIVASVFVRAGDVVGKGETLVTLKNAAAAAELSQAEAGLVAAAARLAEVIRGARHEELAVSRARFADAKLQFTESQLALRNALDSAYAKTDDAIRNRTDNFFVNPRTAYPELAFLSPYKEELEFNRMLLEKELLLWESSLKKMAYDDELSAKADEALNHLYSTQGFLNRVALAVNNLTAGSLSQAEIDGYKTDAASARAGISAEISATTLAIKTVRIAESARDTASKELLLAEAGASEESRAAARADRDLASARVAAARVAFESAVLSAPFSGTVASVNVRTGEYAPANTPAVTIISAADFEIQARISETDIAKVKAGNQAILSLDAYGDTREFRAVVSEIEPQAALIEGIPTYKTTLQFEGATEGVLAGMTADIDIISGERLGVLAVPQRAVATHDGTVSVRVLGEDGVTREEEIIIGLRGSDGLVEILSGLSAGERVIAFEKK